MSEDTPRFTHDEAISRITGLFGYSPAAHGYGECVRRILNQIDKPGEITPKEHDPEFTVREMFELLAAYKSDAVQLQIHWDGQWELRGCGVRGYIPGEGPVLLRDKLRATGLKQIDKTEPEFKVRELCELMARSPQILRCDILPSGGSILRIGDIELRNSTSEALRETLVALASPPKPPTRMVEIPLETVKAIAAGAYSGPCDVRDACCKALEATP